MICNQLLISFLLTRDLCAIVQGHPFMQEIVVSSYHLSVLLMLLRKMHICPNFGRIFKKTLV